MTRFIVCALSLLTASSAWAQFEEPPDVPEWNWRQVLSIPRTGGKLRSITVDPNNPNRIFVGTEESTILRSTDGGVTWREIETYSVVVTSKSVGLLAPGLPSLGATTPNNFKIFVDPPGQRFTHRIPIPSVANPFPVKPDFFFAGFLAESPSPSVTLLTDVVRRRSRETNPIKRIVLCPGGNYEVLAASHFDVMGSQDDGLTWVRLFANPGNTPVDHVVCSPENPMDIAVATGIGLFTSSDGGLTFDQDLSAWPGQRATAVAYGPGKKPGSTELYSASGSEMFAGDIKSEVGLRYVYPSGDSSTAPWLPIRWIASTSRGGVWLATDDGARFSPDRGQTWRTAARTLLSRQTIGQVEVGEGDKPGVERVAVLLNQQPRTLKGVNVSPLHDSVVYSSDDDGESWHPFFHGLSRRRFRQMAATRSNAQHPSTWWIITSGEVWTTMPAVQETKPNREAQKWAKASLAVNPPLYDVVQQVLHNTDLSNEAIYQLAEDHRMLNWVPRLDLLFEVWQQNYTRRTTAVGDFNIVVDEGPPGQPNTTNHMILFAQASWDLGDTLIFTEETYPIKKRLYTLRVRVAQATEDAWHERTELLQTLARGLKDPMEVQTLLIRIETLEAILDLWLGHPLEQTQEPK